MIPKAVVLRLVELAGQAPSVHNTQPWIWRVRGDQVRLYGDRSRQLPFEDPTGRNLVISCGAALDHFRYAARALGWDTAVTCLPEGPEGPLAVVRMTRARPSPSAAEDLAVLRNRCTDRRRFTSWPVPNAALETLVRRARARGGHACSVQDAGTRLRLELLAHQAHELRERVESGDGVIVLGGDADDAAPWLRTGEALSALWLEATRAGMSVVPLSLSVDIDSMRDDLRTVLLEEMVRPHLLVRIGWQAIGRTELPRTPRRPVSELLRP